MEQLKEHFRGLENLFTEVQHATTQIPPPETKTLLMNLQLKEHSRGLENLPTKVWQATS